MTLTARIKASLARSITILVLLGLVASLHHELFGQKTLPGRFKGFRVPAYYKAEPGQPNRLQLILQGKEAYPLANGQVQVLGLQLHYFDKDDGATNLIVEATEGFWDQITKTAYSPSDLKVVLGGGQIELQGRGFTWKQDDSILTISNDVKTTLLRPPPLNLTADRFVFNVGTNRVNYFGNVQGEDTNMILTCEALTLTLPKAATGPLDPGLAIVRVTPPSEPSQTTARPEIDRILAETNVTVVNRRDGSLVKGDRAEYLRLKEGEQIELTGHPSWKQGEREGRADLLRFYQETRLVSAIGQAYVKLPKNEMAQPGLLMPSLSVQTNQGSATGFMEVFADEFHILADGARFDGHVRIEDPTLEAGGGTVRCEKLRIFTGPDKQVSSVVMERDVVLTQGDRARITSDQLVYEKAKDTVELTGNPAWFMEGRQGNADRLSFDLGHKRLLAEGNARLKMPLDNASLPLWSFDESASELAAAGDVFLEASARYYSLDQQVVRFEDDVRVKEWRGGVVDNELRCGLLTVRLANTNQVESVEAERQVVLEQFKGNRDAAESDSTSRLKCEKMLLRVERKGVNSVTADGEVFFEQGARRVRGDHVNYLAESDLLEWTGSPVIVESPEGRLVSDRVLLERKTHRRIARGNIQIKVNLDEVKKSGGTNLLSTPLPDQKLGK